MRYKQMWAQRKLKKNKDNWRVGILLVTVVIFLCLNTASIKYLQRNIGSAFACTQ